MKTVKHLHVNKNILNRHIAALTFSHIIFHEKLRKLHFRKTPFLQDQIPQIR